MCSDFALLEVSLDTIALPQVLNTDSAITSVVTVCYQLQLSDASTSSNNAATRCQPLSAMACQQYYLLELYSCSLQSDSQSSATITVVAPVPLMELTSSELPLQSCKHR
jgi:hypothetical protein